MQGGGGGGEHLGKPEEVISEDFALKKKISLLLTVVYCDGGDKI